MVLIWGGSNSEKPNPLQIGLHSLRHSTALPLCDKFTCSQLGLDFNCKLWSIPQANMIPSSHCFVIGATGCPFSPNPPCLNPLSSEHALQATVAVLISVLEGHPTISRHCPCGRHMRLDESSHLRSKGSIMGAHVMFLSSRGELTQSPNPVKNKSPFSDQAHLPV